MPMEKKRDQQDNTAHIVGGFYNPKTNKLYYIRGKIAIQTLFCFLLKIYKTNIIPIQCAYDFCKTNQIFHLMQHHLVFSWIIRFVLYVYIYSTVRRQIVILKWLGPKGKKI